MAARTVICTLKNDSKHHNLVLESSGLDHGIWSPSLTNGGKPPKSIPFGTEATWGSESHGFMTGTEGTATFWIGDTGAKLKVYWDNPFVGTNEFTQTLVPPAPGSGAGVKGYVLFDPMRPGSMRSRYRDAPIQFEHGNDIAITYRFVHDEPGDARPAPPPGAARPDPNDTRVATAPADKGATTIQCPAASRKLVFVGLSPLSAHAESKQLLRSMSSPSDLTIVSAATHGWVLKDSDFESRTPLLASKRSALKALEDAHDFVETTLGGRAKTPKPTSVDPSKRILMIRALAAVFAEVDEDLNPKADCSALKRLVLSAHHCADWTNGRDDALWGSRAMLAAPDAVLTLFDDGNNHGVLTGLAKIFPKAFLHVEDLCYSACLTGYDGSVAEGTFKLFKNLQTLWGYENESPANGNIESSPPANTSNRALMDWEAASRPAGAADDIDKASKALRAEFKKKYTLNEMGKSIVWVRGTPRKVTD